MKWKGSVIIPAYNESERISSVLNSLKGKDYEGIVVDDGSTDGTDKIVSGAGFRCIRLEDNMGKGYACRKGIGEAGTNSIVILDADSQFDVSDIPRMVDGLKDYDMVIGARDMKCVPIQRRISNRFAAYVVNSVMGGRYGDVLCGFRAVRKDRFMELGMEKDLYEFESELVIKAARKGLSITTIPVGVRYFKGASGIGIVNSMRIVFFIVKELIKSRVKR